MFTGLIEEIGVVKTIVKGVKSTTLTISADKILKDIKIGDSIAVDGICLTARSFSNADFTADVMSETLKRSTLSNIKIKALVNLERALPADGRFGGHIVSGHIDGTGVITSYVQDGNAVIITIAAKTNILDYIVEKGSIAIDGISLTVIYVDDKSFCISIIPHTAYNTTLLKKSKGDNVNLECDIIGKYIKKFLHTNSSNKTKGNIDIDFLARYGFH